VGRGRSWGRLCAMTAALAALRAAHIDFWSASDGSDVQSRGTLFVKPGDATCTGHMVGECSRDSMFDMDVNVVRGKKLTNIRASGTDEAVR